MSPKFITKFNMPDPYESKEEKTFGEMCEIFKKKKERISNPWEYKWPHSFKRSVFYLKFPKRTILAGEQFRKPF